jgi:hypothetical protein
VGLESCWGSRGFDDVLTPNDLALREVGTVTVTIT